MNSGCFVKGEKRVNQGKRGLGKVTVKTREAIQAFTDTNAHKLQMWLDEIHQKDGPKAAFECYTRLLDYTVPKQARAALTSDTPIEHTFRWLE